MAAIPNSGAAATAGANPFAGTAPTAAPNAPGAPTQSASGNATDTFTQLINEMLGGSAAAQQSGQPTLQDLAGIDLVGDQIELQGDDRDSDTDDSDDDSSAEAGVLAWAALLSGLPSVAPVATSSATATRAGDTNLGAIEAALLGKGGADDVMQAAIDELSGDATAAGSAPTDTDAAASTAAASNSQNANATPQIHALMTAHTAAGDVDVTPDAALRSPVGTPTWKDELGAQLTWMAINGREAASLRLSPEHLGPLDIRISMNDGQASVYFGASNPDTRSALEQSLPRLRELFASNGLVLADAGVSRDAPRNAFKPSPQPGALRGVSDASSDAPVKSITLARVGLIDTYV